MRLHKSCDMKSSTEEHNNSKCVTLRGWIWLCKLEVALYNCLYRCFFWWHISFIPHLCSSGQSKRRKDEGLGKDIDFVCICVFVESAYVQKERGTAP